MITRLPNQAAAAPEQLFAPAFTGTLQRKCDCGNHTLAGKCGACSAQGHSSKPAAAQSDHNDSHSFASENARSAGSDFTWVQAFSDHNKNSGPPVLSKRPTASTEEGATRASSTGSTLPYREAKELTECMRIMGPQSAAYCRQEVLGEKPAKCAEANKAERAKGCIQPVVIADDDGKNPTVAPSFDQVTAIWSKCCIDYTINGAKTVKKTAYKTLEESTSNTPSQEESDLFTDAGASTCIQVFVPATFSQGTDTGKHISGGGGTYGRGTANPKVVVVEGAVSEVVAHEVGHASGFAGHVGAGETVMKGTNAHDQPNPHAVSTDVCTRARTGPVLTKGNAKDCCFDPT